MGAVQLRRYEIKPGAMEDFLAAWRELVPVRSAFGFRVLFAFVDEANDEFTWAVTHDGDFPAAERTYYESPERAALARNPADSIAAAHVAMVEPA